MSGGYPIGFEVCNGQNVGANTAASIGTQTAAGGGTPGAPGAWTQLIAATVADAVWVIVFCQFDATAGGSEMTVDIGVGGAGSEKVLIPNLQCANSGPAPVSFSYQFPLSIPAGTRISARATTGNFNADKADVSVLLFDGAFSHMEGGAGVDVIGQATAGGPGTVITSSASLNTLGSYSQLIAATARDYIGFVLGADGDNAGASSNCAWLTDIAIGGSGSEQVIVPQIPMWNANGGNAQQYFFGINGMFMPISIPAGTRIAARCQSSAASAKFGLQLYGVYK